MAPFNSVAGWVFPVVAVVGGVGSLIACYIITVTNADLGRAGHHHDSAWSDSGPSSISGSGSDHHAHHGPFYKWLPTVTQAASGVPSSYVFRVGMSTAGAALFLLWFMVRSWIIEETERSYISSLSPCARVFMSLEKAASWLGALGAVMLLVAASAVPDQEGPHTGHPDEGSDSRNAETPSGHVLHVVCSVIFIITTFLAQTLTTLRIYQMKRRVVGLASMRAKVVMLLILFAAVVFHIYGLIFRGAEGVHLLEAVDGWISYLLIFGWTATLIADLQHRVYLKVEYFGGSVTGMSPFDDVDSVNAKLFVGAGRL